jgi:hypothetical protein
MKRFVLAGTILSMLFATWLVAADSMFGRMYTFSPDGRTCLDCDDKASTELFAAAIAARRSVKINAWLHDRLGSRNDYSSRRLRSASPEDAYEEFGWLLPVGFSFTVDGGTLEFERVPCKLFDCYKDYLTLRDAASGRTLWRRRIPWLDLPVYPFVTDAGVAFIGSKSDGHYLIVLDKGTGRTVDQIRVAGNDIEFYGANPISTFPFYQNGLFVLQGSRVETSQAKSTDWSQKLVPAEIVVVEVKR